MKIHLPPSLIDWLIDYACRQPYQHLEGYMERYWLVRRADGDKGNGVRIHHILRSDHDKHFHNHPWPYISLILRGTYKEVTPHYTDGFSSPTSTYVGDDVVTYSAGDVLVREANHFHRLVIKPGETVWTLFTFGEYTRNWGFLTGPVTRTVTEWQTYLDVDPATYGIDDTSFKEHKA